VFSSPWRVCVCVCVCVCVYVYVCMYLCMHVCMYVCMYVCMHACMRVSAPATAEYVGRLLCHLFQMEPVSWATARKKMGEPRFLAECFEICVDDLPEHFFVCLVYDAEHSMEKVRSQSAAAANLLAWMHGLHEYHRESQRVKALRGELAAAKAVEERRMAREAKAPAPVKAQEARVPSGDDVVAIFAATAVTVPPPASASVDIPVDLALAPAMNRAKSVKVEAITESPLLATSGLSRNRTGNDAPSVPSEP
jgi:hypothetical protein